MKVPKHSFTIVAGAVLIFALSLYGQTTKPAVPATNPTSFDHAAVVSIEPIASNIGMEILKKGGNAVDGAVATAFALAVTHPSAGNLGGGGFMLIYLADRGGHVAGIRLP
jgi:gamma-glutamyltranspeptidase/glutathione hydrolase